MIRVVSSVSADQSIGRVPTGAGEDAGVRCAESGAHAKATTEMLAPVTRVIDREKEIIRTPLYE